MWWWWRGRKGARSIWSYPVDQFHVKLQPRVRRNFLSATARPISIVGANGQQGVLSSSHRGHALVPAGDDLLHTEHKCERFVAIDRAVELASVDESPGIMHRHQIALLGRGAVAGNKFFNLHLRRSHNRIAPRSTPPVKADGTRRPQSSVEGGRRHLDAMAGAGAWPRGGRRDPQSVAK